MPETIEHPTTTIPESDVRPSTGTGDGDHEEDVARAYVTGEAIEALCGKKWVPSRDPSRYPVCPTCVERKAAGWRL